MNNLPIWARKPFHKKEVIATPLGWVVQETGEVLKRVQNLDQRLKQILPKQPVEQKQEVVYEETLVDLVDVPEAPVEDSNTEPMVEPQPVEQKPTVRRRGRAKKEAQLKAE